MESVLGRLLYLSLFLPMAGIAQSDAPGRHQVSAGVDLSFVQTSGYQSWTEGLVGKLRYDENTDGLVISRGFLDFQSRLTDTLDAKIALELYQDDLGSVADVTEAYVEWRPVPRSPNQYRLKVGAFYPKLSFENTEPGWGNAYTLSSSAINTWVAEEIRTFGAELSWSRRLQSLGNGQRVGLYGAAFYANDPAGSLLAWKGWSVHDRQTRFGDQLPLPPLPQIQPGMMFEYQDPYVEPFKEIDDRAGYYVGGEWQSGQRLLVRAMHYDNRADPTVIENGQYAWATEFDHIGAQLTLPGDVGFITQWMQGSTVMGQVIDGAHAVDTEFASYFLLATKVFDDHRVTLRYDNFDVTQNDDTDEDNNPEDGHAWTLGYRYQHSDQLAFAAEWLSIKTHHCGWVYYGLSPTKTETQLQISIQLRFAR